MSKGGSTTNVNNTTTYTASPEEQRLYGIEADYAQQVMPNAYQLNNIAGNLLYGSYGTVQADYNAMNNQAQQQIANAQQGISNLTNGQLPSAYTDNMTQTMQTVANKAIGSNLNSLAQKGVLNSSVTNKALDDVSQNISDTMASNYLNNVQTLSGLYNNQIENSGQNIATSAAAQEAAQQPALNLWNASIGLNQGSTGTALNAMKGTGTKSTSGTSTTSGGGLFSSLF